MSRLKTGCLNEGRAAIDAITPRLDKVIIVIREADCVSAEWPT